MRCSRRRQKRKSGESLLLISSVAIRPCHLRNRRTELMEKKLYSATWNTKNELTICEDDVVGLTLMEKFDIVVD